MEFNRGKVADGSETEPTIFVDIPKLQFPLHEFNQFILLPLTLNIKLFRVIVNNFKH